MKALRITAAILVLILTIPYIVLFEFSKWMVSAGIQIIKWLCPNILPDNSTDEGGSGANV